MEEVDVVGEVCPRPALIVRRRLRDLEAGEELLVRGDYPPARQNLRRTCEKHGFAVQTAEAEDENNFALKITVPGDDSQ